MSDSYLPPFSGAAPHPPGYVCSALCTPWCVEGVTPAAVPNGAMELETLPVPAPRAAAVPASAT